MTFPNPAVVAAADTTVLAEPSERESPVYIGALCASLLWALGFAAFALAYHDKDGPFHLGLFGYALLALVAAAPLGLIWGAAYALSQARALLAETTRARRITSELVGPAVLAAARTGELMDHVQARIAEAAEAAASASARLIKLHETLAAETLRLTEATSTAEANSGALVERLSSQRAELNTLALTLDARAAAVTDAINRQARMVAEASDLAETQLHEAQQTLTARAADLAAAAGQVTDVARATSDDLARQVARLETAGLGVGEQLRSVEEGLGQQRASLVTVAHALRADQEDFAALAETRTARLSEFLKGASRDVGALNEAAALGAQSMAQLIEAAASKFTELAKAAEAERDQFGVSAATSFNVLVEVGAREREALEAQMRKTLEALSVAAAQSREAAQAHAEAARAQVDQLHEAAFAAGQKADQVFETRLADARNLIEQSTRLVEEASAATAAKLEEGVGLTKKALEDLARMIGEVRAAAANLPAEAEAQIGQIRGVIDKGLADLLTAAKRTASGTQEIDSAFQDRVRRNYEMLSEAVQLMGVVAQGGQGAAVLRRPAPKSHVATASVAEPKVDPITPTPANEASDAVSRQRIKLTAVPADVTPAPMAPATPVSTTPAAQEQGEWSWKSLLTSVGGDAPAIASGGPILFRDIVDMGIDPAALLSRRRVEEIAVAVQTGDAAGGREVVRNLAPAAVRRLTRRLIADAEFLQRARDYVHAFWTIMEQARQHDRRGFEATALLASDEGRAFLLLDAAAAETGGWR
jgi:hypothetical protein